MSFNPANPERAATLTREQIETFNERGYVAPITLFDETGAAEQRRYLDGLLQQFERSGRDAYDINEYHHLCQGIYDLVTHPVVLDCVEDLIGPNIVCWGSHYFCKMPGDKRAVPFHQDSPYWPFRPAHAVTIWLAIDNVQADAGPLCFLPGSHRQGKLEWQRRTDDVVLELEIKDQRGLGEAEPLILRAGQFSLHTDLLVHGSQGNFSTHRRCGFTARYVPSEVWVKDEAKHIGWTQSAILCRGSDPSGRWPDNPRPNVENFGSKTPGGLPQTS